MKKLVATAPRVAELKDYTDCLLYTSGGGRSCFVCGCVSDFQETGSAVVGVTDSVIRMIVETSPFTGSVFAL